MVGKRERNSGHAASVSRYLSLPKGGIFKLATFSFCQIRRIAAVSSLGTLGNFGLFQNIFDIGRGGHPQRQASIEKFQWVLHGVALKRQNTYVRPRNGH